METVILPGFSPKNKDWAEEVQRNLKSPAMVVYWLHWTTGTTEEGWIEKEAEKVVNNLRGKQVNIVAKSIGTAVAMVVIRLKPELVNTLILCGVPINDFASGDEKLYEVLRGFPANRVLCIQNQEDNHGAYPEVEKFLHGINLNLAVIAKPRSDHEYPYVKEFAKFLQENGSMI